jgi:hypothetical protein
MCYQNCTPEDVAAEAVASVAVVVATSGVTAAAAAESATTHQQNPCVNYSSCRRLYCTMPHHNTLYPSLHSACLAAL